jgi:hypothetical protein
MMGWTRSPLNNACHASRRAVITGPGVYLPLVTEPADLRNGIFRGTPECAGRARAR